MQTKISDFIRHPSWSFYGWLLALPALLLTIYFGVFQEKRPAFRIEIISSTSVVDIHENVQKLEILYEGGNIQETGQALRVILLKATNDGSADILESFYAQTDPVGLRVSQARIIQSEVEVIDASNDYLKKNQHLSLESQNKLLFSPVILESGEYFIIKLILLHPQGKKPEIHPIGKIAGVKEITIEDFEQGTIGSNRIHFWSLLGFFLKSILASLLMLVFIYLVGWMGIGNLLIWVKDIPNKRYRRRVVERFKGSGNTDVSNYRRILSYYIKKDFHLLSWFTPLEKLHEFKLNYSSINDPNVLVAPSEIRSLREIARALVKMGIATREKNELNIDEDRYKFLLEFQSFRREHHL